ncbi:MAG: MBL fold metallo-hydrolase [Bacteroidales bacterium]
MLNRKKILRIALIILIVIFSTSALASNLQVHFIDVGQGDSILIQSPDDHNMLIDGGPRSADDKVTSYLQNQGVDKLEYIISTHPHADHIGGLLPVLEKFKVNQIIDSGRVHTSKTYENYLLKIDELDIPYQKGRTGDTFKLGDIEFTVLHPDHDNYDLNNSSVVLLGEYDLVSFLFAGDAEHEAEKAIIKNNDDVQADVIKVGHHGSRTSSSSSVLSKVSPEAAVIMAGEGNQYGHPHDETLDALAANDIDIYRTDKHGTIVTTTDGETIEISTEHDAETTSGADPGEEKFVGSVNSDKYHYPSCRWAENINPENEVWFDTAEEAQNQGYEPCGTCKPPS